MKVKVQSQLQKSQLVAVLTTVGLCLMFASLQLQIRIEVHLTGVVTHEGDSDGKEDDIYHVLYIWLKLNSKILSILQYNIHHSR